MKIGKYTLTVSMGMVLGLVGSLAIGSVPGHAATTPSSCLYVFAIPHADDELLTMGMGIRQHVNVHGGSKVCVVLMTTGENSGVYDRLKATEIPNLTPAQFRAARDREMWNSVLHMGVPSSNIYINGYTGPNTGVPRIFDENNGSAVQAQAIRSWMYNTMRYFGTARHYKTMTDKSNDTGDHHAMGANLRQLTSLYPQYVASARYYIEPYRLGSASVSYDVVSPSATDRTQLQKANNAYNIWNPVTWLRVGWRSVGALMQANLNNPSSYQHS